MKNQKTQVPGEGADTYAKLFQVALNAPTGQGFSMSDMAERLPILGKLKSAEPDDEIELTAEELTLLNRVYQAHKWGIVHEDIFAAGQALKEAATT